MGLLDKAKELGKTALDKAKDVAEDGKNLVTAAAEDEKVKKLTKEIGEKIVARLDAGESFGEEVDGLFTQIKEARAKAAELRVKKD